MSADLTIGQGLTSPVLTQTITDAGGSALNLTGGSVQFVMRRLSAASPTVNAACALADAPAGQVSYNWSTADTATPGLYMGQFLCTLSSGATYAFPNEGFIEIEVQESLVSAGQQLVSVADVKDVLNFQSTNRDHDTKILRWINACRPVIEGLVGPVIVTQFEEFHDGGSAFIIVRRRPSTALGATPVLFVNAISEYNGPIEWALSEVQSPDFGQLYSVEVDINLGQIVRRTAGGGVMSFPYMPQSVHLWYTAGQSSVPDSVYEATLELIRQNYQHTAQASRTPGRNAPEPVELPPMGFFVPGRVRELLGLNRRAPSIA